MRLNPSQSARSHAFDIKLIASKKTLPTQSPLLSKDPRGQEGKN